LIAAVVIVVETRARKQRLLPKDDRRHVSAVRLTRYHCRVSNEQPLNHGGGGGGVPYWRATILLLTELGGNRARVVSS